MGPTPDSGVVGFFAIIGIFVFAVTLIIIFIASPKGGWKIVAGLILIPVVLIVLKLMYDVGRH
jgi:hypothetical protein